MKKFTISIFHSLHLLLHSGKKIIALVFSICAYILLHADGVVVNSSNERILNIDVSVEGNLHFIENVFSDGKTYSRFFVSGTGQLSPGKPDLPGFAKWILVPNGTGINISATYENPVIYENIDLAPVQPEPYDNLDAPLPPFTKDEKIYSTDSDFPGVFAETEKIKYKRGQALTLLWIYPYQYNPVQKRLTVYTSLNVTINFEGTIKPVPDNLKSKNLIRSLKSMAINADVVLSAEENAKSGNNVVKDAKANGCEMLIITHPDFISAASTLAAWKIRKGIYTWVVTTATTGNTKEQIEDYIDDAYENWSPAPDYLLFIGDAEYIPTGYILSGDSDLGTDFFYADYDDPADFVADFGYGRLSVDDVAEADSVVARIIRYERTPTDNPYYYNHILNAACFQDGENLDSQPDELPDSIANRRFCKTSEDVRNYLMIHGFSSQREYVAYNRVNNDEIFPMKWNDINQAATFIFENDNPPYGGEPIPLELQKPGFPWDGGTAGIAEAFNAGKYLALFRAHGYREGWSDPNFNNGNVDALDNGEDRPFIWSVTCQSGWFDNETDSAGNNTGAESECFAEHWLRHNTGGSCGILAASRNSQSGKNDRLIWGMMDAVWPDFTTWCLDPYGNDDSIYRMSDVINYGKNYMLSKYGTESGKRTVELYHWFGDPTSEMWTSTPVELSSVEVTSTITIGTSSITVLVHPAVENMLVAVCTENADNVFGTAYTNASGSATVTLNHPITIEDDVFITITKHNYKPYEILAELNAISWKGIVSSDWNNVNNWTGNQVPDASSDVSIPPDCPHYPVISTTPANCNNLTINTGASLTIGNSSINIYGNFFIYGELAMNSSQSVGVFHGTINWQYGSSANITNDDATFVVYDTWTFNSGSCVQMNMGTVKFTGDYFRGIKCYSDCSYFNNIIDNKAPDNYLYFWSNSTQDLVIKGSLKIGAGADFRYFGDKNIQIGDSLICNGNYYLNGGTLIFNGSSASCSSGPDSYFHDLEFNTSGLAVLSSSIVVRGNLNVEGGSLYSDSFTISLQGDWSVDANAGFAPGTGTVRFYGDSIQRIKTNEDFNILMLDKNGGSLKIENNTDVSCNKYDWENGEISVVNGSFTVDDLVDNGICGKYTVEQNGVINLTNYTGYVHLKGELTIHGGTINVYGGTIPSFWGNSSSATLNMDGGIVDFHDVGINFYNLLTLNITTGEIRTSKSVYIGDPDVHLTSGDITLYGSGQEVIQQVEGGSFYNINIDKSTLKNKNAGYKSPPSYYKYKDDFKEDAMKQMNSAKSPMISDVLAFSDLDINGSLKIINGDFDVNGHTVDIAGGLEVNGNITMTHPDDILLVNGCIDWNSGCTALITDGLIEFKDNWHFHQNIDVQILSPNTAAAIGTDQQILICDETNTASFGELLIEQNSQNANVSVSGSIPVVVSGNLSLNPYNYMELTDGTLIIQGVAGITENSFLNIDNTGQLIVNENLNLRGSLTMLAGNVIVHNDLLCNDSGSLIIEQGNLTVDKPASVNSQIINGQLVMTGGELVIENNTLFFGTSATTNITGGEIIAGSAFKAIYPNTFHPEGGVVKMTGSGYSIIDLDTTNYFHNLIIEKPVSDAVGLVNPILVDNDLTINNGRMVQNTYDLTINGNLIIEPDGKLEPGNATIYVCLDWINNNGTAGFEEGSSKVCFFGMTSSYVQNNEDFYNLEVNKTGGYTYLFLDSAYTYNVLHNVEIAGASLRMENNATLNIGNDLVIDENAALFVSFQSGSYINIFHNFINHNTSGIPFDFGFQSGLSTINFNGVDDQYIISDIGSLEFNNLMIDKSSGEFYPAADISVKGDLNIINGVWGKDDPYNSYSFYKDINITDNGSFDDNTCTMNIVGSDLQHLINNSGSAINLGSLNVEMGLQPGKGSYSFMILGNIHCQDVTVDTGAFIINSQTVECEEGFTINQNGVVMAPNASIIKMGNGSALTVNGGEIQMIGNTLYQPGLTHITGNYELSIINNGTLTASNAIFEFMDINGVNIYPSGLVYGTNALSSCTFRNGASGGKLLTINNDQDLVINGAIFPDNTWSGSYNVSKTNDHGTITFNNYSGNFAGTSYENDPYNRINWGMNIAGIWTGTVSDVWNDPANWQNSLKPGTSDDVYIPSGTPNDPVIGTSNQDCNNLTLEAGATLEIYNKTLTVHADMLIYGELRMNQSGSVLYAGDSFGDMVSWESGSSSNITNGTIYVYGDWHFKNGTDASLGSGCTVIFNGPQQSNIYCADEDAAFGNLTVSKPSPPKDYVFVPSKNILRVSDDLYITDGILDVKEGCEVMVGNEFYIDNGGAFNVIGTEANESTVSGYPDYCLFEVASGGLISADYTIFEYIEYDGITVDPGATVNTNFPFSHCTFRESPAGGTLLNIANSQNLTIDGANFPPNTWNGGYNVGKPNDNGHLTFTGVEGGFAGSAYENDPFGRIDWPGVTAGIWTGSVSSVWDDPANWKYHLKPSATDDVTIPSGTPNEPSVFTANQECQNLIIESGASLSIRTQTLTVHDDLIIYGKLIINHTSSFLNVGDAAGDMIAWRAGSTSDITGGSINVFGDWYFYNGTDASFGPGNLTTFYGTNLSTIHCLDPDANFGNLTISKTSAPHNVVTLPANNILRIAGSLYLSAGVLSLEEGTVLETDYEIYVDDGCELNSLGTFANNNLITGTANYCQFVIAAGATIGASYTTFEYIESPGITIENNAAINALYPFNNCTFRYGRAGGTLLAINNDQFITIDSVSFPENTWLGIVNVKKTNNNGQVTFTNFSGLFAGEYFENDPYSLIDWSVPEYWLHVKVYLEGPFNGTNMNYGLTELPLQQPFNIPPWNYNGFESVSQIPNHVVDWVLVELRSAPDSASATSDRILERRAAFLKDDGTITDTGGSPDLQFDKYISQQLYVVVRHRNHLDVMSAFPLQKVDKTFSYDFTPEKNQAYGSINGHKQLAPGIWGMIGGDSNADGNINTSDKTFWENQAGLKGYKSGDFNLNGQVNNIDKNDIWLINSGKECQVPD